MAILWKPTGSLDINTAPTDLPEQANGSSIVSGAMVRCKNLRLDRHGIASLRDGSTYLAAVAPTAAPDLVVEAAGNRFIFAGDQIYYNEVEVTSALMCAAPAFSPDGDMYLAAQSVTITSTTTSAVIYYTLDGSTPTRNSAIYSAAVTVPGNSWLKAFAVDSRGLMGDSSVTSAYYGLWAQNALVTDSSSNQLITETDSNALTTEGP